MQFVRSTNPCNWSRGVNRVGGHFTCIVRLLIDKYTRKPSGFGELSKRKSRPMMAGVESSVKSTSLNSDRAGHLGFSNFSQTPHILCIKRSELFKSHLILAIKRTPDNTSSSPFFYIQSKRWCCKIKEVTGHTTLLGLERSAHLMPTLSALSPALSVPQWSGPSTWGIN